MRSSLQSNKDREDVVMQLGCNKHEVWQHSEELHQILCTLQNNIFKLLTTEVSALEGKKCETYSLSPSRSDREGEMLRNEEKQY